MSFVQTVGAILVLACRLCMTCAAACGSSMLIAIQIIVTFVLGLSGLGVNSESAIDAQVTLHFLRMRVHPLAFFTASSRNVEG